MSNLKYTNTDLWDYFANGSEYDMAGGTVNEVRESCCKSCAFSKNKETVRPDDVSIKQLEEHTRDMDVFYCHTQTEQGNYKVCAGWAKRFPENFKEYLKNEDKIEEILNKDTA